MNSIPATAAIRAWINDPAHALTGDGNPLARGAYLLDQRSPADGPYGVVSRTAEGVSDVVAEYTDIQVARIQVMIYAGTQQAAEAAGEALRAAFEGLTGCPELCGDTGVLVLVADNHNGPFAVPGTTEAYCFQVGADFMLVAQGG